jgi:hypothetical protein
MWSNIPGIISPEKILPGQFVTGRYELFKSCYPKNRTGRDPSPWTVWRWLHTLQDMQNLSIKTSNKFSLVTITNWETYQSNVSENEQQNEQEVSNRCTTDAPQMSTNKNEKNVKKYRDNGKSSCTLQEAVDFCLSIDLQKSDAEYMVNHWIGNGWMNGKQSVKDWKATIRSWKAAGHLPSQKNSRPQPDHNWGRDY